MTAWVRYGRLGSMSIAGAGAILLAAAPNAAAYTEGNVAIEGSNPQTGCSYKVTSGSLVGGGSSSVNGLEVTFLDNGATIGTGTVGTSIAGSPAQVSWTPSGAGQHVLTASGTFGPGWETVTLTPLTVQVRASTSTGSFGCPLPSISG